MCHCCMYGTWLELVAELGSRGRLYRWGQTSRLYIGQVAEVDYIGGVKLVGYI